MSNSFLQNKKSFTEIDFLTLFFAYSAKNGTVMLNIDNLEKRLFKYIDEKPSNINLLLSINKNEKVVNLKRPISYLGTIGSINYFQATDNSPKCVILMDEAEIDKTINNYFLYDIETTFFIKNMVDKLYPAKKKVSRGKPKQNIKRLF